MKMLTILTIGLLASLQAFACSCRGWETVEDLKQYDAIWLAIPEEASTVVSTNNTRILSTKFNVIKSFKGQGSKLRHLRSIQDDGANCGISFVANQGLVLIGSSKGADGKLTTNVCSVGYVDGQDPRIMNIIRDLNKKY